MNGEFMAQLCKVRDAIELSFGVLSGVGPRIGVLDGFRFHMGKRGFGEGFLSVVCNMFFSEHIDFRTRHR